MAWKSPHPAQPKPVRIDPDAENGRAPLVGSTWKRREPLGDEYDEVVIRGVFDLGNDHGGLELVVSPATFGPAVTTQPEALSAAWKRIEDDDPTERLSARLAEVEARIGAGS